jgi:peptidoglycan/xylan/chitin deacetylase (PgdA/CDA1 family)
MAITLMYHDVVPPGDDDASGFPCAGSAHYKLTTMDFAAHVEAIARAQRGRSLVAADLLRQKPALADLLLTFDDGGVSAATVAADLVEKHGWRGHFFISTDYLNSPTFLSSAQVRELHRRGHVIGSHSCSHPERISSCSPDELRREWRQSCNVLANVIGEPVTTASVPGGFYSRAVAEAAAQAGIRVLFNSEPTTRTFTVDGCLIVGRFTVYRGMSASSTAALVSGRVWPRLRQALSWNAKKVAKAIGGRPYLWLRELLLRRKYRRSL